MCLQLASQRHNANVRFRKYRQIYVLLNWWAQDDVAQALSFNQAANSHDFGAFTDQQKANICRKAHRAHEMDNDVHALCHSHIPAVEEHDLVSKTKLNTIVALGGGALVE